MAAMVRSRERRNPGLPSQLAHLARLEGEDVDALAQLLQRRDCSRR
jgi:hypothetical protein